ncbi:MAG: hypothetical protein ACYTGV_16490 [Planctomycetota bacterium]|jgi:hypothetical protein
MWQPLRDMAGDVWRRCRAGVERRRMTRKRARFWEEVRAGEREAKAQARPADAEERLARPRSRAERPLKVQS